MSADQAALSRLTARSKANRMNVSGDDWRANTRLRVRRNSWHGIKPLVSRALYLPIVNPLARGAASLVLGSAALHRLPFRGRAEYVLASGEKVVLLDAREDQVAKDLLWGGGAPVSRAAANVLRYVERGKGTFLDIGAYSGLFALIAAKAGMRAIAFEILPENYFLTARNIVANDLAERAEVRLCGVSDHAGAIVMPRSTGSAAHPSSMSLAADYVEGVSIPTITIDSLGLGGPMLWKLDVEGFEWSVLEGARETIRAHTPDIICEVLPQCRQAKRIEEMLKPLGYRFYLSLDSGLEERSEIVPTHEGWDWIFTLEPAGQGPG
jgi:FkbM family methyltransferase